MKIQIKQGVSTKPASEAALEVQNPEGGTTMAFVTSESNQAKSKLTSNSTSLKTRTLPDKSTQIDSYDFESSLGAETSPTSSLEEDEGMVVSPLGVEQVFSKGFLKHRTGEFIGKVIPDFLKWSEVGSQDGLIYISSIKNNIEHYAKVLDYGNENRQLLGILQLALEGDDWETYTSSQLNSIANELQRFTTGEVTREHLNTFTKQMYRLGIALL